MLVKWNPYTDIEKTVDSLFRRPFALRPFWDDRNGEGVGWQPAVNVYEDKDKLSIEAQLPGIDLKDCSKFPSTVRTLSVDKEARVYSPCSFLRSSIISTVENVKAPALRAHPRGRPHYNNHEY